MRNVIAVILLFIAVRTNSQTAQTLYFDPASAIGAPVSRLFESITYIPLETTKQSLFGAIRRLIVTPNYFVIYDDDTEGLYFFDKTGKFIKKYKDEKYTIARIQYLEKENSVYIVQMNKNFKPTQEYIDQLVRNPFSKNIRKYGRAIFYKLTDVQKEEISEMPNFEIYMANPNHISNNLWAYSILLQDKDANDSTDYELKISDGKNTIKTYFPYNKHKTSYYAQSSAIAFAKSFDASTLLFTRPYDYWVYMLTPDSVKQLYKFVLPFENTVPKSFYNRQFSSRNDLNDYKQSNPGYVWSIYNLVQFKSYLFFSLDYQKKDIRFLYDNIANRFYNVDRISADSTNGFLPVMGWNIQYQDQTALYSSVSSVAMFNSRDAQKQRNPVYSELLRNYFEKSKPSSNPVIIILKPLTKNK